MKKQENYYPCALTIAGSDSGGGAGIQADLRTFSAIGVYGCSAITAVTSQNPRELTKIDVMSPETVVSQLEAVLSCFHISAVKTGMLANAGIVKAVAAALKKYIPGVPLVTDPVLVSSTGKRLLDKEAEKVLKDELLPLASWITPNIPEAEALLDTTLPDFDSRVRAAAAIAERWSCSCLLKGGHDITPDGEAVDIAVHNKRIYTLAAPALPDSRATHGTGCTLASAIAGLIAAGNNWRDTVCEAKAFVYGSILEAALVGPKCEAMYPPLENYRALVAITEIRNKK